MAFLLSLQCAGCALTALIVAWAGLVHSVANSTTSVGSVTPVTHFSTTPNRNPEKYVFESSCATVNWSLAETACVKKGTAIFTFSDVATSIGSLALRKAQAEHGTIWVNMDINGTCYTAVGDSMTFNSTSCSDNNHYLCTSRSSTNSSSEWYIPCPNDSSNKERPSFHGSCLPANAAMAKKHCEEKSGIMFTIDDLRMVYGLRIMESAIEDLGDIWMLSNGSCTEGDIYGNLHGCCKSAGNGSRGVNAFTAVTCKELRHYVCRMKSTGQVFHRNGINETYIPCKKDMSSPAISATVVIIVVVVTVAVVLGFILGGCCLFKCVTKPIKYAVRVQSALYHRHHPEPGPAADGPTQAADMLAKHVINLNKT
ncbi:uncharacterized protein LOC124136742 isoform X1 [Haliotis rufescens]|uniref:uncharacterized protein LOC124136742 isoform X1 n=1 Tax=Haliotis rufescens TaxID=6454 RepID=UPI00201E87AD|nr:uncharacterized protein LOC124136742 isoform X1 [Haliotis rufescens]